MQILKILKIFNLIYAHHCTFSLSYMRLPLIIKSPSDIFMLKSISLKIAYQPVAKRANMYICTYLSLLQFLYMISESYIQNIINTPKIMLKVCALLKNCICLLSNSI